jgi:hypothetical protein
VPDCRRLPSMHPETSKGSATQRCVLREGPLRVLQLEPTDPSYQGVSDPLAAAGARDQALPSMGPSARAKSLSTDPSPNAQRGVGEAGQHREHEFPDGHYLDYGTPRRVFRTRGTVLHLYKDRQ